MTLQYRLGVWSVLLASASIALSTATTVVAQSVPQEIVGHKLPVPGEHVAGTTAKLSEVEAEMVAAMPPQQQAERLLQYAISHHVGATDEIKARVKGWRGTITTTASLETLVDVALNGDDLRVRAAACEIVLAARNIVKSRAQVEELIRQVHLNPNDAAHAIWVLGLLANRGVEAERIHAQLRGWMHSPDDMIRFWAVTAIGHIGTDDTVPDLVHAFHHDASSNVRINGAGCGLAHCGMLTRAQRMQAVPGLIEMVEDTQLDAQSLRYGYRALREITDETVPDDAKLWRVWYAAHGYETTDRFRKLQASAEQDRKD